MKTSKPRGQRPGQAELPDPTSDDDLLDSLRAGNWFDSVSFGRRTPWVPSVRIFGNANIGSLHLTNLQIPSRLAHGRGTAILQNWYLRTNIPHRTYPELDAPFRLMLEHAIATMVVGDRVRWRAPLSDLYRAGHVVEPIRATSPRPCWPLPVPAYQTVQVTIDFFTSRTRNGAEELITLFDSDYQAWSGIDPMIWIHLEGVELPEHDDYDGTDEESAKRWRKLTGRVMRLLTRSDKHVEDTAEHIARWLGAQLPDDADEATKAQFTALADAVRERRFDNYRPLPPEPAVPFRGALLVEDEGAAHLQLGDGSSAAVAPSGAIRLRFNRDRRRLQLSMDAGAYMDIITPIGNNEP